MPVLRLALQPSRLHVVCRLFAALLIMGAGATAQARVAYVQASLVAPDAAARAGMVAGPGHLMPQEGHRLVPEAVPGGPGAWGADRSAAAPVGSYAPGTLDYAGGPVIHAAKIHNVLINCTGNKCWGAVGSAITPDQLVEDIGASRLIHVTDQYVGAYQDNRYVLGTGVVVSNYVFTSKNKASAKDILNIVTQAATTLGASQTGYGHIYALYFPSNVDVCNADNKCFSSKDFCAYHNFGNGTVKGVKSHLIYVVMPYQDAAGCAITGGPNEINDSTASVFSHELIETITDPDFNAWINKNNAFYYNYEIGDECQLDPFTLYPTITLGSNKYKMQLEYSNDYHGCVDHP